MERDGRVRASAAQKLLGLAPVHELLSRFSQASNATPAPQEKWLHSLRLLSHQT